MHRHVRRRMTHAHDYDSASKRCTPRHTLPPKTLWRAAHPCRDYAVGMDYRDRITIEPGKRGGKPCIRGLRITCTTSSITLPEV